MSSLLHLHLLLLFLLPLVLINNTATCQLLKSCGFSAIYNFGDSLSDTGNALVQNLGSTAGRPPFGMTVGRPSGRFSDGFLLVDRIAESAGLPHCNPYLNKKLDHSKGANFAVGGVGLLSKDMRDKFGIHFKWSNSSLPVQLQWFHNQSARKANLESALFMVGGGGNDYGGCTAAKGPEQKKLLIPYVIAALKEGIKTLIHEGARRVVAVGVYQGGCLPGFNKTLLMHDQGPIVCDKAWNSYHDQHNKHVQQLVRDLAREFPHVRLAYGDLWGGVQWMFDHYHSLETYQQCGEPGTPYCKDPSNYIWWDAFHFTDHAYRLIAGKVVPHIYADLDCAKHPAAGTNSTTSAAAAGPAYHHLLFTAFIICFFLFLLV